jgi:hypothetical protein
MCSLKFREEHQLRVAENRVRSGTSSPKGDRKLKNVDNEDIHIEPSNQGG